ncbi:hypothetical protein PGAL8A_00042600 [Plasmodium gallinaceum]|uniref:Fam-j protein n=1 Tax=Plasmodium gallinaceum TaxID=5849 RepID=A0A1J1H0M3_PLAGA|nr:hypothetical protein PGAL8A_00042600 [Plasmodium gallinaceum]CRG97997.1 hypothetical protein PGAL8A_00042600 [Plasmodium gallinaceum]
MLCDMRTRIETHKKEFKPKILSFDSEYFFEDSQNSPLDSPTEFYILHTYLILRSNLGVNSNDYRQNINISSNEDNEENTEYNMIKEKTCKEKSEEDMNHEGSKNTASCSSSPKYIIYDINFDIDKSNDEVPNKIVEDINNYLIENVEAYAKEDTDEESQFFIENFSFDLFQNIFDLNNTSSEEKILKSSVAENSEENKTLDEFEDIHLDLLEPYDVLKNPIESLIHIYGLDECDDDQSSTDNSEKRTVPEDIRQRSNETKSVKGYGSGKKISKKDTKTSSYKSKKKETDDYDSEDLKCFLKIISHDISVRELDHISSETFQNIHDILNSIKSNYNKIISEINGSMQSLAILADEELKNIDLKALQEMENCYNRLPKYVDKSLLDLYYHIILSKNNTYHITRNKAEIVTSIKKALVLWEKLLKQLDFAQEITRTLANIIDNFTYTKIFFSISIFSENLNCFSVLFEEMENLIESISKSVNDGFSSHNKTKIEIAKKSLYDVNRKTREIYKKSSSSCLNMLRMMDFSGNDNNILLEFIFNNIYEENEKSKKIIESIMEKYEDKNTIKMVHNFFSKERERILKYKNYSSTLFCPSVSRESMNKKSLHDIINNPCTSKILQSLYQQLRELMGISIIRKQADSILMILNSLNDINLEMSHYVRPKTGTITENISWLNLYSKIQIQKDKFEEVKLNMKHLSYFKSLRKNILDVSEAITQGKSQLKLTHCSFNPIVRAIQDDESNAIGLNGRRKIQNYHILFSLFYMKKILELCNIREIS